MNTKSGFIAIVGRPNVGKSTILNALIGEKIAIVSDKPQTTRTRIMGVLTKDNVQLVFTDTPGMHKAKTKLSEYMVKQVRDSVADVDLVMLVTEATGELTNAEKELIESIGGKSIPAVAVVNKIDLLPDPSAMLAKLQAIASAHEFLSVVPVSARTGDGMPQLLEELMSHAEEGPHYFDEDTLTDQPERVIVAEIVREKILRNMEQEIPHGTAVVIESMKEREGREDLLDIDAYIYCEKDSHKGMIIGKHGAMLKKIASEARVEVESFLGVKINLQCWVKVKEDWRNRAGLLRNFGFDNRNK